MHFKELRLYGFKSFAEETKLNFDSGVTAIVGPNGCGKSNLADAVKWVLGEQSAKELRGSTMEDVIFNGTDGLDAKGMAKVSLTLSNESNILPVDYDEVTISRKVYRSGESEYFINKSKVRLKDVQNLIRGTGIGTSAYSIMEQGRIDLVLSSKPQDRRHVFEEASGITKYKGKKRETLNKLDRTQENLQRVNDIIGEVERQLRSIKRKVKKAQRYKKKFDNLEKIEMIFGKIKYNKIHFEIEELKSGINGYDKKIEDVENNIANDKEELFQFKSKIDEIEQELEELRSKLIAINNLINESRSKTDLNHERIKDLNDKINNINIEKESIIKKIDTTKQQHSEFIDSVGKLKFEKEDINNKLEESGCRINDIYEEINQYMQKIKSIKTELVDDMSTETNVKNNIVRINTDLRNFNNRLNRLNNEKRDLENEKENLSDEISKLKEKTDNLSKNLSDKEHNKTAKTNKLESFQSRVNDLKEELNKSENKYNEAKNKYNLFKQLKNSYEGFSSSIKALTKIRDEKGLQFKVLAELIEVSNGYELAVESALGADVQAILVDDRKQIPKIFEILKEIDKGSCRIIIFDEFCEGYTSKLDNPIPDSAKGKKVFNYIKPLDENYNILFSKLLQNKYIVEDEQDALMYSNKDNNGNNVFYALNGGSFQKGKVLTGKTNFNEQFSLIGRGSIIDDLSNRLLKLEKDIKGKKYNIKELESQIINFEKEIEELEQKTQIIENEKRDKENMFKNFTSDLKKIKDEYLVIKVDIDEVRSELSEYRERKQKIEEDKEQISNSVQHKNELISNYQNNITELTQEKERLIVEKGKLESKLSGIEEKRQSCKERIDMFKELFEEQQEKLDFISKQKKESEERILCLKEEIQTYDGKVKEHVIDKEKLVNQLHNLKDKRKIFIDKKEKLDNKLSDRQQFIQKQMHKLQNENMRRTQLEYKKEQIEDRIRERYKKELKNFEIKDSDKERNIEDMKKEINKLNKKLDSMGSVNLMAIDEHEDLKERHSFLIDQREDLLKAEQSLRKAIKKINETTRSLFMETFEKIHKEFGVFFRELFGGGKALLRLEDEKNILESGIEIVAQPKGKKLQNISLLSGGEKTLTAVALLFAIFKVKPSPFCLLDEIDAPLDEANIDRFSKVLQEFIGNSQFIIITHNKKTISLADIIYGVTMEKSGVSKIVSVKLIDEKKQNKKVSVSAK